MSLDPDLNSQPRYTTIPGDEPVELLGNGTLIVRASLMNDTDIRMVVSVAEDNFQGPVTTLRQSITQVYIDVRPDDYNYHAPVFGQETYESSVLFSATTGTEIPIDGFRAMDADGHNVTYSIQTRNDRGNLKIDSQTGTISVQFKFDDTVHQILKLVITATDNHPSPKTGSCTVSITLVGYTQTELVAKTEYSRLEQDAGQRQLFLGLFIAMAILLGVISIVAVLAIYKWRTVTRGPQYPERSETAPGKGGKESGEDGYDSLGAKDEEKDYNQLSFRDFSAGVPNPAYVSSGPRPTCTPPAGPHPDQTDDMHLGRDPPPAVSEM
ncbi:uncharacterized protein LOC124281579 [Haliotis rubra]|uniref:uncharacterized protein LOC124281579 n=1 Tax=Haliotis rubra TaxID=36100 RepID=UPI001EE53C15|nr:uncharacterized protein LOC124281579 [Haliotis rubra]